MRGDATDCTEGHWPEGQGGGCAGLSFPSFYKDLKRIDER